MLTPPMCIGVTSFSTCRNIASCELIACAAGPRGGGAGEPQQDGVEDLTPDVVEVDVDAVRGVLLELGAQVARLVVDGGVEAELVDEPAALVLAARDADGTAPDDPRDLA